MPVTPQLLRRAQVAALLAGLGLAPSTVAVGIDAGAVAREYLQRHPRQFGLGAADIREVSISSIVPGTARGMQHVYLQQRLRGIPVWNGVFTINVRGDGSVLNPGNRFVDRLPARGAGQAVRRNALQAVRAAADFLELRPTRPWRALSSRGGAEQALTLSTGGIASRPVDAGLVWFFARDLGQLRLSWRLQIETSKGAWDVFVDAGTGEPLAARDRIVRDSGEAIAAAIGRDSFGPGLLAAAGTLVAASPASPPAFASIDGASYTVFPFPFENPGDGGRRSVSGAASPQASPYGWHDTNGAAGADSTRTRGNNAIAYIDADADDQIDAGSEVEGTAALQFAPPMLAGQAPAAQREASVVNLFYWTNIVHDIAYHYGFTEAAGNFQTNNYGKGGMAGDEVLAEAQDGSGTNNANFSTGPDGSSPRMQMYRWEYPFPNVLSVATPAPIAGSYVLTAAAFGPSFAVAGPKSAALVLASDGAGSPLDACEPLVGFPAGAVAVVERGGCNFTVKVKGAQLAGAIAVVVVNNIAGEPITLGGADASVTIPAGMISQADGNLIRPQLPGGATAQANGNLPIARDSALDAGVVVHEYGHGISSRLTGGPIEFGCLQNDEQMGEGWSDFFAATFTARSSDRGSTRRGMSNYLAYQPGNGRGIRPTPYSTDLGINPSTYAAVADATTSMPHGIGYVWNSMLWEVYWNLVNRHGFNGNLYEGWQTGGNNLALQLVMDGLKMQPCSPGFVDGRNAILAADQALTGAANKCEIWRGFAKRGLGLGANQGLSANRSDGTPAFDLPAACQVAVFGGFQAPVLPAPALTAHRVDRDLPLKFTLSGVAGTPLLDTQAVDCATLEPDGSRPIALASVAGLQQLGNSYAIDWQPRKAWAGSCRAVTLRVPAASDPVAYFRFEPAVAGRVGRTSH